MKIIDIFENLDTKWLDSQINELQYAFNNFNRLVQANGYERALRASQDKINLTKSADWYYSMLAQNDSTVKQKYKRMINIRTKLEKLINTGLSYE